MLMYIVTFICFDAILNTYTSIIFHFALCCVTILMQRLLVYSLFCCLSPSNRPYRDHQTVSSGFININGVHISLDSVVF